MPIEFACPSCHRRYRVKDELAGKGAKCGKCGHRMRIPQSADVATPTLEPTSSSQGKAPSNDTGVASWIDEELEVAPPAATSPTSVTACPACGSSLTTSAIVCVVCGFDTRTGKRRTTDHDTHEVEDERRSSGRLGSMASLLRGTLLSFLAAMLGAVVWAVLAYFTMMEFGFIAWGLGGLAGLGMALGHEDDDGTVAGILAAVMSLFGIVAAKVLIVLIFIGMAFASVVGEMDFNSDADPVELKRSLLAVSMAEEKLEAQGTNMFLVSGEEWDRVVAEARDEIVDLSEEEIDARLEEFAAKAEAAQLDEEWDAAEDPIDVVADEDIDEVAPGMFFQLIGALFGPMDGLFILLAFFTAYKVGSGQMTS